MGARDFDRSRDNSLKRRYLTKPRVIVALSFVAILIGLCLAGRLPWGVLGVYATTSAIAFGTYGYDKFQRRRGAGVRRRKRY